MKLLEINKYSYRDLYRLISEREEVTNISHRDMPSWDEHVEFVSSQPYVAWYMISVGGFNKGAIYLTDRDEIGVFVFKEHQSKGYGSQAVKMLMDKHPRERFLANINPQNVVSVRMFSHLGFQLIQHTYELRRA